MHDFIPVKFKNRLTIWDRNQNKGCLSRHKEIWGLAEMFFILIWEMVISEKLLRCIKHFTVYKLHLNQVLFKNKLRYYTQPQGVNLLRVTRMLKFQKSYHYLKKGFIGCGLRRNRGLGIYSQCGKWHESMSGSCDKQYSWKNFKNYFFWTRSCLCKLRLDCIEPWVSGWGIILQVEGIDFQF